MDSFIVTCEHGGNRVPAAYRHFFRGQRRLLDSHRGYDLGALVVARALAKSFAAPLVVSTVSRLLVDLNRSIGHRQLFAPVIRGTPVALRAKILRQHYLPYRAEVEQLIARAVARGRRVIHLSSHSFTPVLDGAVRCADVGLLYDPGRRTEAFLCAQWKAALVASAPELRVRRNYPYAGKCDGLTSYLRRRFPEQRYVGIEIEINQRIAQGGGPNWKALRAALIASLRAAHGAAMPLPRA